VLHHVERKGELSARGEMSGSGKCPGGICTGGNVRMPDGKSSVVPKKQNLLHDRLCNKPLNYNHHRN